MGASVGEDEEHVPQFPGGDENDKKDDCRDFEASKNTKEWEEGVYPLGYVILKSHRWVEVKRYEVIFLYDQAEHDKQ